VSTSVTIVGGGQAGGTLALALRSKGHEGVIRLVCREYERPYERPPLSKGILAGENATWVAAPEAYDDNDIELHLGRSASVLRDAGAGWEVELDDGAVLRSDVAVLATGSAARALPVPGASLGNVVSLGTLQHARRLRAMLPALGHVVIVGAGFVGTEVAAALRLRGIDVTIVDPVERPLEHAIGAWASAAVRDLHHEAGVAFVHDGVAEMRGADVVREVVTMGGQVISCDLVLVAVGSRPVTDLADRLGLDCASGVQCDERGRTARAGLYAIGDVAAWPYGPLGQLRVEHFRTAIEHAEVVAADVTGDRSERNLVPWFWTDQYHRRVEVAGRPSLGDVEVIREAPDGTPRMSLHLTEGRVVGAIGIDAPREVRSATQLIRQQTPVDPGLAADPTIDLRKVATAP
jgi:3-phenylpropionate/trans-cinnamate dioxygenase ferredoxin reductase subunit